MLPLWSCLIFDLIAVILILDNTFYCSRFIVLAIFQEHVYAGLSSGDIMWFNLRSLNHWFPPPPPKVMVRQSFDPRARLATQPTFLPGRYQVLLAWHVVMLYSPVLFINMVAVTAAARKKKARNNPVCVDTWCPRWSTCTTSPPTQHSCFLLVVDCSECPSQHSRLFIFIF